MRRPLVIIVALASLVYINSPTRADAAEDDQAVTPWRVQAGVGAEFVYPAFAPVLRGAVTHDELPFWVDLRVSWAPRLSFGFAEVGMERRFQPAAVFTPVWTARFGVLASLSGRRLSQSLLATTGLGFAVRFTAGVSMQVATELSFGSDFNLPLLRVHALVNHHF